MSSPSEQDQAGSASVSSHITAGAGAGVSGAAPAESGGGVAESPAENDTEGTDASFGSNHRPQRLVDSFIVVRNGTIVEQVNASGASVEPGTELFVDPSRAWNRYHATGVPDFYTVVLTSGVGDRRFGACLYFSTAVNMSSSSGTQRRHSRTGVQGGGEAAATEAMRDGAGGTAGESEQPGTGDGPTAPGSVPTNDVVLAVLSHWPFYSLFKDFLSELYQVYVRHEADDHGLPVERFLCAFVSEAPLPHPNCSVEYPLLEQSLLAYRPPVDALPYADPLVFATLFTCLTLEHVTQLVSLMLLEQRIMLLSQDRHRLTACAEALQALLFPFTWQHVYIPLLPAKFLPFAQAPVPLMIGVEACFAEHADIRVAASAAVVVDLDADQISPPEDTVYVGNLVLAANDPALQFPPHIARAVSTRLHASLERMGLALPTVSSTLAQPDDAVDYAKRRSTNDLGAPLNSLAFCQASVDLRTALAQSTGGHHSMPSPAARPLSPLATMCAQWRWVAQVRAAFTALFCQLFEGWDMELEPHLDKSKFLEMCPLECQPFLRAFFETQIFCQFLDTVGGPEPDRGARVFSTALQEWRGSRRSDGQAASVSPGIVGRPEKSLRFRALLPAAFGAMMVSTVARPLPTAGVRKLIRRSTSSSTHASSDNDAVGAAPSHHEFPRLDKGLFPAPEPLHVAASKASASPASWSAMVSRYHNSGRLTSSLLARRGTMDAGAAARSVDGTVAPAGAKSGAHASRPRRATESAISIAPLARRKPNLSTSSNVSTGSASVSPHDQPEALAGNRRRGDTAELPGIAGVDRALIESARRRAAVQTAALVDARNELALLQEQLNHADTNRALLLAQLNDAKASAAACQSALSTKEDEVAHLRDDTLPAAQSQNMELTKRVADLENRLQVAIQDIRHLRGQLNDTEEQLSRSQHFSVALMAELNVHRQSEKPPATPRHLVPPPRRARERPHPLLAAASPRSSTSHAGTPTARDRNHDRAAREQPSNSRVPLNGSVGRRLRESAYKVQLLEERLKHEAAQRKRLFSMLQDLKRDVRAAQRARPSTGRIPDARSLSEEVSSLSTQLQRAAHHATSRSHHLEAWVAQADVLAATDGTSGEALSAVDGDTAGQHRSPLPHKGYSLPGGPRAGPSKRRGHKHSTEAPLQGETVLASAVSSLLLEASTQVQALTVFLHRIQALDKQLEVRVRRGIAKGRLSGTLQSGTIQPGTTTSPRTSTATRGAGVDTSQSADIAGRASPK